MATVFASWFDCCFFNLFFSDDRQNRRVALNLEIKKIYLDLGGVSRFIEEKNRKSLVRAAQTGYLKNDKGQSAFVGRMTAKTNTREPDRDEDGLSPSIVSCPTTSGAESIALPGRVLITRLAPEPAPSLIAAAADVADVHPLDQGLSPDELRLRVRGKDAVFCMLTDRIDAEVLGSAAEGGCRLFANMAVGYNNIDVDAASRLGILVTNTPGVLTEATADLTWTLILGVARRAAEGDRVMRAEAFPGWGPLYMLGGDVGGRTLGLVGPGRIALAVAQRALGFRMRLLHCGRRPAPDLEALGSRAVGLDELLSASDFVSLHVPLNAETRHLIDERALKRMKPSAYLINTARGPVADEQALVRALSEGWIAGAGLDVYEDEPRMARGLAACPNTMLLPHLGSATIATRSEMARVAAENIVALLRGRVPPNVVNPQTLRDHPERFSGLTP